MNGRDVGRRSQGVGWVGVLAAVSGCQVLFGVDLPGQSEPGAGSGGSFEDGGAGTGPAPTQGGSGQPPSSGSGGAGGAGGFGQAGSTQQQGGGGLGGAGQGGGGAGGAAGNVGAGSSGASGSGGAGLPPICVADGNPVNVVKCDKYQDCTNLEPPSCPPGGASCEIQCSNEESCLGARIDCNGAIDCIVRCSGQRACRGANVICGPGTCKVICGDETEEEDDGESCSAAAPYGDMQVDCSGTTGNCTICGVAEPGVTIANMLACTSNGCSCGAVGSCN